MTHLRNFKEIARLLCLFVALLLVFIGCGKSSKLELSNAPSADAEVPDAAGRKESTPTPDVEDVDRPASPSPELAALVDSLKEIVPSLSRPDSYVSSSACVECHPNEHRSWHKTYHRTMTQLALPGNVLSDFKETTIQSAGLEYRVFRKGDEYWAEMPDPDRMLDMSRGDPSVVPEELPRVQRRVVMTTGSHHYQTYWVGHDEMNSVMNTLPLVYLPAEDRWIPRVAAFISPPDQPHRMITIWNDHCINCHSTGGNPGLTGPKTLATEVGELGISCEACHGPGENHVAHHRGKPTNASSNSKVSLAHPAKLDNKRSSQICGQCHGVFIRVGEQGMKFAREGIQYRPGEDLHASRYYIKFPHAGSTEQERATFERNREFYRERWWDDGTILAGGREYTAMQNTACFTKGEMSCLSCHSMHNADPDNQLLTGMESNQACVQCHDETKFTSKISSHTNHAAESSGSECMNCHMPHTSYALFSAIRNHSITSPNVRSSFEHGVPNACNLCHLDQTLDWTQIQLATWYGHEPVELEEDHHNVSAAVLWLLKGHAAQRVVAAWHFGWSAAHETSNTEWMMPVLAQLLRDPYPVVRRVAAQSVRTLNYTIRYDFLGDTSHQDSVIRKLTGASKHTVVSIAKIKQLLKQRDDRPVSIKE